MVEIDELWEKKIVKLAFLMLVFMIAIMFIFGFGLEYYNKFRCYSEGTVERMKKYCESNDMELREINFIDGLCISVCGR